MKKPKTSGALWLYHSMAAFNGSGYADKSSPEDYVNSYILYKAWKNKKDAVEIAKQYPIEAMTYAEGLMGANDAGRSPSDKNLTKFMKFIDQSDDL